MNRILLLKCKSPTAKRPSRMDKGWRRLHLALALGGGAYECAVGCGADVIVHPSHDRPIPSDRAPSIDTLCESIDINYIASFKRYKQQLMKHLLNMNVTVYAKGGKLGSATLSGGVAT